MEIKSDSKTCVCRLPNKVSLQMLNATNFTIISWIELNFNLNSDDYHSKCNKREAPGKKLS